MGLSGLSNMMRSEEVVNALAKIKSFIPREQAKDIELKVNQIYIDLSPWMGNKTVRIAEPYQLVLKNSRWYVQGYCRERKDFRLFKLSRISNLQMQEETFSIRDYQKLNLDFTDILKTMQTSIKIRIHRSLMDRVLDFCSYENFSPDGDAHYIVSFPFVENDYYYNIFFSFTDQCECLEPASIRTEIKRRIQELAIL